MSRSSSRRRGSNRRGVSVRIVARRPSGRRNSLPLPRRHHELARAGRRQRAAARSPPARPTTTRRAPGPTSVTRVQARAQRLDPPDRDAAERRGGARSDPHASRWSSATAWPGPSVRSGSRRAIRRPAGCARGRDGASRRRAARPRRWSNRQGSQLTQPGWSSDQWLEKRTRTRTGSAALTSSTTAAGSSRTSRAGPSTSGSASTTRHKRQ